MHRETYAGNGVNVRNLWLSFVNGLLYDRLLLWAFKTCYGFICIYMYMYVCVFVFVFDFCLGVVW